MVLPVEIDVSVQLSVTALSKCPKLNKVFCIDYLLFFISPSKKSGRYYSYFTKEVQFKD